MRERSSNGLKRRQGSGVGFGAPWEGELTPFPMALEKALVEAMEGVVDVEDNERDISIV